MNIIPVTDKSFAPYGRVVEGYETAGILKALLETTPCPEGVVYFPKVDSLHAAQGGEALGEALFGGMPFQLGCCNGHNTKLNCLEYHRDSEFNLGTEDFILLLGLRSEIGEDGMFDTAKAKAFRVPAGVLIEVYATTLHFAPCGAAPGRGFKVLVVLPRGTNTAKPDIIPASREDRFLRARNKWLLAHPESRQAKDGAAIGLKGRNIDLAEEY
jgi:hypothetical protein